MRPFIRCFHLAALAAATLLHAGVAAAQAFPAKPLRWVVAYAPGGGSDQLARTVAAQLSTQLGQQVIVENRPGGATVIAAELVARAPADGYTIFTSDNGTLIYNTALFKRLPYDPQKDFAPVGLMARFPLILAANPASGYANARQLVEAIRKSPGKLSYASPGIGSPHHLAMEMLKERAKLEVEHVAYKGAAPAVQDVVGGQVPLMVVDTASGLPMLRAGRLKPMAVFSRTRLPSLPDVPTLMELGLTDIEAFAWQGMVVPAATPADVVGKLSTELRRAIESPAVKARLQEIGLETIASDPQAMSAYWSSELRYWPKLIRDRQISLD